MYLVDTDVLSEARKGDLADPGVRAFFREAHAARQALYLSVVTVGEVRRGIERIRHRGDTQQAERLEVWLGQAIETAAERILPVDADTAQVWGRMRVPHPENPLDKLIAATALLHDLVVVTRNGRHFSGLGVRVLDPFHS